jgi:hypothetical protein
VFLGDMTKGIPPKRDNYHDKHPHIQKIEIENIVEEMLEARIIRHSQSAYSSPMVVVCKKDENWCMFLDYRVLNSYTIKNITIPIINDFLDKMNGDMYFTKLDLRFGYHQL